jgi:transposase-like protein
MCSTPGQSPLSRARGRPFRASTTPRTATAEAAIKTLAQLYGAKFPKAVKKITDDKEQPLAFSDFPAEHWTYPRTTDPIESAFSTVRLRTKVTRGAGSRAAALAMVFRLIESAQQR